MGLTAPVAREAFHRRRIECEGFRREDGLWDIEAHLVDTKTYAFENAWRGEVAPGTALHDMWLRITLDDDLVVRDVEAVTTASPFPVCPAITPNFRRLIGEKIGAGWKRRVRTLLGGVEGCTHLVELLGPVATTAFQTIHSGRARALRQNAGGPPQPPAGQRSPLIDSCHGWRADGEAVKRNWPEHYTGE